MELAIPRGIIYISANVKVDTVDKIVKVSILLCCYVVLHVGIISAVSAETMVTDHHVIQCDLVTVKPRRPKEMLSYRKYSAIDNAKFVAELRTSRTELINTHAPPPVLSPSAQDTVFVRDIGVFMDNTLCMSTQVARTCQGAYFQLHKIAETA